MNTDTNVITALPIAPENYELEHYNRIDYDGIFSKMAPVERRFINGLIRYYKPQRLLELGVARGAGTVNILNAISDMPKSNLTSIDKRGFREDDSWPLADIPKRFFPNITEEKWRMIAGKDPSEVIEGLGMIYDFAVIDTLHLHPVESLNFLCILPYLADGAIVVLHDISLYWVQNYVRKKAGRIPLAGRILQSSVVAEKLLPKDECEFNVTIGDYDLVPVKNITALQITPDTRKYIGNVFIALQLPWQYFPDDDIDNIRKLLKLHYSPECMELYEKAAQMNKTWVVSNEQTFSIVKFTKACQRWIGKPVLFYGAGKNMRNFLSMLHTFNIPFDFPIWDINAAKIREIEGHKVTAPDFETQAPYGNVAVITIADTDTVRYVREQLSRLGFIVFTSIEDFAAIK